jgi:hypothetical protein
MVYVIKAPKNFAIKTLLKVAFKSIGKKWTGTNTRYTGEINQQLLG